MLHFAQNITYSREQLAKTKQISSFRAFILEFTGDLQYNKIVVFARRSYRCFYVVKAALRWFHTQNIGLAAYVQAVFENPRLWCVKRRSLFCLKGDKQ